MCLKFLVRICLAARKSTSVQVKTHFVSEVLVSLQFIVLLFGDKAMAAMDSKVILAASVLPS